MFGTMAFTSGNRDCHVAQSSAHAAAVGWMTPIPWHSGSGGKLTVVPSMPMRSKPGTKSLKIVVHVTA